VRCEIAEVRESSRSDTAEIEGKRIMELLNPKNFVCLLESPGGMFTSEELAAELEKWQMQARKEVTFIIGGADGVSSGIREIADFRLSLSFMTFTHEMARVILLEQLYRAFTILKGFPYQR
jgi:23S rRNA (pseudouridine1915-N3)-methyltransferase